MVTLIWNDLRHHARQWLWSLLVATVGGAIIGVIITAWYSALNWAQAQGSAELINAAHIIGSSLVSYAGLATAVILSTTLGLTVSAQQRSHALWKVLGIPGSRIRRIILAQVGVIGLLGGVMGAVTSLSLVRVYLLTWREFDVFPQNLPIIMPGFGVALTIAVTMLFCVLGAMGPARRAASVPEMQALREASAPRTRTRWWQWVVVGIMLLGLVMTPFESSLPMSDAERAEMATSGMNLNDPGDRAMAGASMGLLAAIAALSVPSWTLRPLLTWWTALIPGRSPAWFAARANALRTDTADIVEAVPVAQVGNIDKNLLHEVATPRTSTLYLNTRSGPFADPALRAAARNAVDPAALIKTVFEGHADSPVGLLGPAVPWAAELRAWKKETYPGASGAAATGKVPGATAAGTVPAGTAITLASYTDRPELGEMVPLLAQQLEAAGFKVTQDVREYNQIESEALAGKFHAVLVSRSTVLDSGDAVAYMTADFSSSGSYSMSGLHDEKVDAAISKAAATQPGDERHKAIMAAEQAILASGAAIPLAHERVIQGEAAGVTGAQRDPGAIAVGPGH